MKKLAALILTSVMLAGCVVPILIGAGIVTGFGISNDSVIGNVHIEYRALWDIVKTKMQNLDAADLQINESKGLFKGVISDYAITIKIDSIDQKIQKLKVSARKMMMPKPAYAQKIFMSIIEQIK